MMALYRARALGQGHDGVDLAARQRPVVERRLRQGALTGGYLPLRPPRERPRSALGNLYRPEMTAGSSWRSRWRTGCGRGCARCWSGPTLSRIRALPRCPSAAERRRADVIFDKVFAAHDACRVDPRLKAVTIPFSLIARIQDIATDEQARASGAVVETGDPGMPLRLLHRFSSKGPERAPPRRSRPRGPYRCRAA